jgi:hypothetical protein
MLKELNFEEEAKNLQLVHRNLCGAGLVLDEVHPKNRVHEGNCVVPLPSAPLCVGLPSDVNLITSKVFCMDFIDGFKISDIEWLDHFNIDRTQLLHRLVEAFSQQVKIHTVNLLRGRRVGGGRETKVKTTEQRKIRHQ